MNNPIPILQQEKSSITTNPFIPNDQKIKELEIIDKEANKIIEDAYNKNKTSSIANLSITDIVKNIADSIIGLLDDLFTKPEDINWVDYILNILQKNQRYTYIGILLLIIAFYILIIR
jgi:hypothetical protein